MSNDIISRNERAQNYIKKCHRRNIRKQRRRERNISKIMVAIERSAGIVALVLVGVMIGGWIG